MQERKSGSPFHCSIPQDNNQMKVKTFILIVKKLQSLEKLARRIKLAQNTLEETEYLTIIPVS